MVPNVQSLRSVEVVADELGFKVQCSTKDKLVMRARPCNHTLLQCKTRPRHLSPVSEKINRDRLFHVAIALGAVIAPFMFYPLISIQSPPSVESRADDATPAVISNRSASSTVILCLPISAFHFFERSPMGSMTVSGVSGPYPPPTQAQPPGRSTLLISRNNGGVRKKKAPRTSTRSNNPSGSGIASMGAQRTTRRDEQPFSRA
jgi:hypothetical protein